MKSISISHITIYMCLYSNQSPPTIISHQMAVTSLNINVTVIKWVIKVNRTWALPSDVLNFNTTIICRQDVYNFDILCKFIQVSFPFSLLFTRSTLFIVAKVDPVYNFQYVLRSSGISRKSGALIVRYSQKKGMHFFCFLLFQESFYCYNFASTGRIQVGFSAKCSTPPNEDFNQIEH